MYRGRGGGGGGRPYPLRGVRPVQMKPGRGRSAGPPGYPPGRPRPLLEPGWGPHPHPPMMRGMGPRPPPFAAPMRGRGGPPVRGRGAAPGPAGRGWSSTRSRGTRGRGARGRGAPAAKSTAAATKSASGSNNRSTKGEKEKDELALSRPWITDALKVEIQKKSELQAVSLKTKADSDFEAFKEQRTKVSNMLRAAKLEYIGMQDEQDVDKIMADARQKSKEILTAESKAAKSENGNGASEGDSAPADGTAAPADGAAPPAETAETASNGDAATTEKPSGDGSSATAEPAAAAV